MSYDNGYQLGSMIYDIVSNFDSDLIDHDSKEYTDYVVSWVLPISNEKEFNSKGIESDNYKIIIRSYNDKKIELFKKIFKNRKVFSLGSVECKLKDINNLTPPDLSDPVQFKTICPVLVKNMDNKPIFADENKDEYIDKLEKTIIENYSKYVDDPNGDININAGSDFQGKSLRISSNQKHRCYSFYGFIEGSADLKEFAYYCGLGNNTHFGLGCWEAL